MSDLTYNEYLKYNNEINTFENKTILTDKEKSEIFLNFLDKFLNGMHELDPEINQLVSEHFDELLL